MLNLVKLQCRLCEKEYKVLYKYRNKSKYCSKSCCDKSFKGNGNPAFGKTYNTKENNPGWAENIRKGSLGKVNLGDKNGMKQIAAKEKVSKTRKQMFKDNPELKKELSIRSKKAWADGKFEGVRVGQCKWYEHIKPDGKIIKVQGTWELAFVKWADENNLNYTCHIGRVPYVLNGEQRSYYPDFYVEEWNCWVDVKNDYHYSLQKDKFDILKKTGVNIKILLKEELIEMGVKLK